MIKVAKEVGKGFEFQCVMCFSSSDGFIWEIGPVRVEGKTKETHVYQASRQFIRRITGKLTNLQISNHNLKCAVTKSIEHLNNMRTYMDLIKPMDAGPRGEGKCVEIKKPVNRSNVKQKHKSQADLLIVTFFD